MPAPANGPVLLTLEQVRAQDRRRSRAWPRPTAWRSSTCRPGRCGRAAWQCRGRCGCSRSTGATATTTRRSASWPGRSGPGPRCSAPRPRARSGSGRAGRSQLRLPAGRELSLPVSGVADLARARPLFSSRRSRTLEDFLYVPQSIVVSPAVFAHSVDPGLRAASAELGGVVKSLPVEEVDVLVERARLQRDPAAALRRRGPSPARSGASLPGRTTSSTTSRTRSWSRAPTPRSASGCSSSSACPAILLAASARRLRRRRARRGAAARAGHAPPARRGPRPSACACSATGRSPSRARDPRSAWSPGFCRALAILGSGALRQAAPGDLALSAARSHWRAGCSSPRSPSSSRDAARSPARSAGNGASWRSRQPPAWRRLWLDVAPARRGRASPRSSSCVRERSTAPPGSVFAGRSVSLPSYLLLVPLLAAAGGVLLATRVLLAIALRLPVARRARRSRPGLAAPQPATAAVGARRGHRRARARDRVRDGPARLHSRPTTPPSAPTRASSWAPISASRRARVPRTAAYASRLRVGG